MTNYERLGQIQLTLEKLNAQAQQLQKEKNEVIQAIIEEEQKPKTQETPKVNK